MRDRKYEKSHHDMFNVLVLKIVMLYISLSEMGPEKKTKQKKKQGYSITNSVGTNFKIKKCSWA